MRVANSACTGPVKWAQLNFFLNLGVLSFLFLIGKEVVNYQHIERFDNTKISSASTSPSLRGQIQSDDTAEKNVKNLYYCKGQ